MFDLNNCLISHPQEKVDMELTEKQLQIMDDALDIFANKGFEKATVRDIAQKANVNIAMISYYFGSKDNLLEVLFQYHMGKMNLKMASIISSKTLNSFEKVNSLIDNYINAILENRNFFKLMIREGILIKEGPIFELIKGLKFKNIELLSIAVKQGQKNGSFQKDADVLMMTTILLGSVTQVFSNSKFISEAYGIEYPNFELYNKKVVDNLRKHLKLIFKSYLTLNI